MSKYTLTPKAGFIEVEKDGKRKYQRIDKELDQIIDAVSTLVGREIKSQNAAQLFFAVQKFAATLDETAAMEIATVYPSYEIGKAYKAGDYFTSGENNVGDPQLYVVLQSHTSAVEWTPDTAVSLYKTVGITEEGYAEWSQPVGSTDAYNIGDIVSYNGTLYRSVINANVWSPTDYPVGWEIYTE